MKSKENQNIIDKGFYNHQQQMDSMNLKQYIIVRKDGKKCLLLRFFNASNLRVNAMELVLTQKNLEGETIDTSAVSLDGIDVHPGETFTASEGIILNDKCADFTVTVNCLISGGYRYFDKSGRMIPHYDPNLGQKKKPKKYGVISVNRKRFDSNPLPAVIAIAVMAIMAVICAITSFNVFGKF